jgi:hypothetical protein
MYALYGIKKADLLVTIPVYYAYIHSMVGGPHERQRQKVCRETVFFN